MRRSRAAARAGGRRGQVGAAGSGDRRRSRPASRSPGAIRSSSARFLRGAVGAQGQHVGLARARARRSSGSGAGAPARRGVHAGRDRAHALRVEPEQLDQLARARSSEGTITSRAPRAIRGITSAVPGAVGAPEPVRLVKRRQIVDHAPRCARVASGAMFAGESSSSAPRRGERQRRCSHAWPAPGRARAGAGSRRSARAGAAGRRADSSRAQRSTPPISRRDGGARVDHDRSGASGRRAGAARRRSRAASPRRSPAGMPGEPVRGSVGAGGLLRGHRLLRRNGGRRGGGGSRGGVRLGRRLALRPVRLSACPNGSAYCSSPALWAIAAAAGRASRDTARSSATMAAHGGEA